MLGGCAGKVPPRPETEAPAEPADPRRRILGGGSPMSVAGPPFKVLAEFNRGAALMEQYRYSEAAKAFQAVQELAPDWLAARFNLGLAYFNMHGLQKTDDPTAVKPNTVELRSDLAVW